MILSKNVDEEVIAGLFKFSEIVLIVEILVAHLVRSYSFTFRVLHVLSISEFLESISCFLSKDLSVACCTWGECVSADGLRFTQQSLAAVMRDHSKNTP